MKIKIITSLLIACGLLGMVSDSQAVSQNTSGLGQVLIYPYYTTRGGNSTLISIANTSVDVKALKVRFLEGKNSRPVLDFNLYLSPWDIWVAEVAMIDGVPHLFVPDSSCTVPYYFETASQGQSFTGDRLDDGYGTEITRATEGHFEVIEMGTVLGVDQNSATAIFHIPDPARPKETNNGRPKDCNQIVNAWANVDGVDGYWLDGQADEDISAPSGGLHGGAAIINVDDGTLFSYDAIAIDQFFSGDADPAKPVHYLHTAPGSQEPTLNSGDQLHAQVPGIGTMTFTRSVDAVSALFMHNALINEFTFEQAANAHSEWVLTSPTRRFYVDPLYGLDVPVTPYTQATSVACESLRYRFLDREEGFSEFEGEGSPLQFPPPNAPPIPTIELCSSTQVLRFGERDDFTEGLNESEILGSLNVTAVENGELVYFNGWVNIWLTGTRNDTTRRLTNVDGQSLLGLPVTGFWVERFANGKAANSIVARNYAGLFVHKGTRKILEE